MEPARCDDICRLPVVVGVSKNNETETVPDQTCLIVGLTGGIGSGKSAVCREFEQLGVPIIDTDIIAREVVAPGSPGLAEVTEYFGGDVLNADGTMDRARLRALVFADETKRAALEAILHPKIRDRTNELLAAVVAPYCILCVPLLIEKGGYKNVHRILVVDCPPGIQLHRVMARDNLTQPQAEAIMRSQAARTERLRMADDIIENSGSLDELQPRVETLHARYTAIAEKLKKDQAHAEHRNRSTEHPVSRG